MVVWTIETAFNQALLKQKKRNYNKVCGKKKRIQGKKKTKVLSTWP